MGNCIGSARAFGSHKKVSPDEDELNTSIVVAGKISSGPCSYQETASLSTLLKLEEVQHVFRLQLDDTAKSCQRMKIVVNRKQLELLKRSLEELKPRHLVIRSVRKRGKKWSPSLATIPEL